MLHIQAACNWLFYIQVSFRLTHAYLGLKDTPWHPISVCCSGPAEWLTLSLCSEWCNSQRATNPGWPWLIIHIFPPFCYYSVFPLLLLPSYVGTHRHTLTYSSVWLLQKQILSQGRISCFSVIKKVICVLLINLTINCNCSCCFSVVYKNRVSPVLLN